MPAKGAGDRASDVLEVVPTEDAFAGVFTSLLAEARSPAFAIRPEAWRGAH